MEAVAGEVAVDCSCQWFEGSSYSYYNNLSSVRVNRSDKMEILVVMLHTILTQFS